MGIPFVCNHHPRNVFDYEHVWIFRKKSGDNTEKIRDWGKSIKGVIGDKWSSKAGIKTHCAAFPIELPKYFIEIYSDENDVVLDPFMGSGTTACACIELNRQFIGFENDKEFYEYASVRVNRYEKDAMQKVMF